MTLPQFLAVSAVVGLGWLIRRMNRITKGMVAAEDEYQDWWETRTMANEKHRPGYIPHHWSDPDVQSCESGGMIHSFRSGRCVFCQGEQCPTQGSVDGRCQEAADHPGKGHRLASGLVWVPEDVSEDA